MELYLTVVPIWVNCKIHCSGLQPCWTRSVGISSRVALEYCYLQPCCTRILSPAVLHWNIVISSRVALEYCYLQPCCTEELLSQTVLHWSIVISSRGALEYCYVQHCCTGVLLSPDVLLYLTWMQQDLLMNLRRNLLMRVQLIIHGCTCVHLDLWKCP